MELISREEAIKALEEVTCNICEHRSTWCALCDRAKILTRIHSLPIIEERKEGKWEQISVFGIDEATTIDQLQSSYCPNCHRYHTTPYVYSYYHYDYCPNCGARMKGAE